MGFGQVKLILLAGVLGQPDSSLSASITAGRASEHSGSGAARFRWRCCACGHCGAKKIRCQRVLKIPAENPVDGYIVLWYLEATIFLAAVIVGFGLVGLQQEFDVLAVGADIKERRQQDGKQAT